MKTWAYLFGYHGNRYNCYQIWDWQVCPVYINWKKRAFISSFFIFCKEVCFAQCVSRKNTLFFVLKIRSLNEWSWNKKEMKELELADLDVLVWASRSSIFVVISRELSISCACGTLLVSSFFWNSPWLFSFLLASFRFKVTPQPKNIKEKLNHLFLFFFLFLHTVLREYAQHYKVSFFYFFFTL